MRKKLAVSFPMVKKKIKTIIEWLQKYNYHIVDSAGIKLQIMKNRNLKCKIFGICRALRLISENKVFLNLLNTYSLCDMMCCLFSVWHQTTAAATEVYPVSAGKLINSAWEVIFKCLFQLYHCPLTCCTNLWSMYRFAMLGWKSGLSKNLRKNSYTSYTHGNENSAVRKYTIAQISAWSPPPKAEGLFTSLKRTKGIKA